MEQTSFREELAEGVYLLNNGTVIKATQVAKSEAEKLLSEAAKIRGVDDGEYLNYPAEDGRNSIPLYELGQKGYIKMKPHQFKEHLIRLVQLVPDYLKERGFLPNKKAETVDTKVEKEYNKYLKEIMTMKKRDIIGKAQEINDMKKIKEYICNSDFPQNNFGLLIGQDNLLQKLHTAVKDNKFNLSVTNEAIGRAINTFGKKITLADTNKCLQPFSRELEVAKKNKYEAVTFTIKTPDKPAQQIAMNLKDFYRHLDSEMLDRFSQSAMPDFPSKDFYGKPGEKLFEDIREKRFCANLKQYFYEFSLEPQNGYLITIDRLEKKPVTENEYKEIKNRNTLRDYASACYANSAPTLKRIDEYFHDKKDVIEDIQKLISPVVAIGAVAPAAKEVIQKLVEKVVDNSSDIKADINGNLEKLVQQSGEKKEINLNNQFQLSAAPKNTKQNDDTIKNILDEAKDKKATSQLKNKDIIDNILSQINPVPQAVQAPVIQNSGAGLGR